MKKAYLVAIAMASLVGCSWCGAPDYGGKAIDVPGTFDCFDRHLIVKVEHARAHRLNCTVGNNKASIGPSEAPFDESAPWIIFPETPGKVWVYDGAKDITLVEVFDDGGSKFTSSQIVPGVLKSAPAQFISRLPADVVHEPG
jgi:hypothetical protein